MQRQKNEPNPTPQDAPDLFDESRDHSNQWDISVLWEDASKRIDPKAGPEAE